MREIFSFLKDIAAHNDREWFAANRSRYDAAAAKFAAMTESLIGRVAEFEPSVAGITVKSTLYRFCRDTRFSADKSPYKRHFGTFINPLGKKSIHGGYYLHVQPGGCFVAAGAYCLPADALRAVRQSIVAQTERFRAILTEPQLAACRPVMGENRLKTLPKGFPRDYPYPKYLQPREYGLTVPLADKELLEKGWQDHVCTLFRLMKPFVDFLNETVDDYI